MKPLKWQEDDPVLAQEVREAAKNGDSSWWHTVADLLNAVVQSFLE